MSTITSERVEFLLSTIGPRQVAVVLGAGSSHALVPLRRGEPVTPVAAARLNLLADVVAILTDSGQSGAQVASMLRAQNDDLAEGAILLTIAGAQTLDAVDAARNKLSTIITGLLYPAMG